MTGRLAVRLSVALPLKQVVPARAQMGSSLVTVGAVSGTVLSFDTGLRPPRECFHDREGFCPRKGDKILHDHETPGPAS